MAKINGLVVRHCPRIIKQSTLAITRFLGLAKLPVYKRNIGVLKRTTKQRNTKQN